MNGYGRPVVPDFMDLTDQQWTIIEPLFEEKRRPDGRAAARGATRVRCSTG
jgi:transposase